MKFTGHLNKQFEEPFTQEYDTGVAVVYNASTEEFSQLLSLQDSGEEIELDEFIMIARDSDQAKHLLSRLEQIFIKKTTGLKKLAIDKEWMNDKEAINDQYRIYEEMYKNAKAGHYDKKTNEAIIKANEGAKKSLAQLTLFLNSAKGKLERMILSGDVKADEMLMAADNLSLKKEDLTPAKMKQLSKIFL